MTLKDIRAQYGDDVRIVWKSYVVHPQVATDAAYAMCAASKQGKGWEFHDALWLSAWDLSGSPRLRDAKALDAQHLLDVAAGLGLDMDRFKADMNGKACSKQLVDDMALLSGVGVRGTPAFYINGRYLSGAQPIESFQTLIDEEKAKAEAAYKKGVRPARYFQDEIVKKGKTALP